MLNLYEEQNKKEEYKKLVKEILFKYNRGNFNYYKKLKEICTQEQWESERDRIIEEFEKDGNAYHRDDLRQMYIEEEYYDKLYASVMTTPAIEVLIKYEKYLKKDFEKQLLKQYKKIVDEKSKFTGKRNYEELRKMLEHMKTLKNGEELVEKMVQEYKIKYANRKLMLEELEKMGK